MATVEAVARENGSVFAALADDGTAVFPADDAHAAVARARRTRAACSTFGARRARPTSRGTRRLARRRLGAAMRTPAGAATLRAAHRRPRTTCATRWPPPPARSPRGVPLDAIARRPRALRAGQGPLAGQAHRAPAAATSRWSTTATTPTPIRCAPRSTCSPRCRPALARARRHGRGRRPGARRSTREVGAYARERGIETLWALGAESANTARAVRRRARISTTSRRCIAALGEAPRAASVLVKGSRFMQMERVVAALHRARSRQRRRACCLASPSGCRRTRRSSASCASSSTSPSAR